MRRNPGPTFLIAFLAEIGALLWWWGRYPTDTVRALYDGSFWRYAVEHIIPWALIFFILWGAWALISKRALK
jgi:hypothetical protein